MGWFSKRYVVRKFYRAEYTYYTAQGTWSKALADAYVFTNFQQAKDVFLCHNFTDIIEVS